jgi:hypothetical protein
LLGIGKTVDVGQHRCAQLMQSCKWQLHFRLYSGDPNNWKVRSLLGPVVHERCLADSCLTTHDQSRAFARTDLIEQPAQLALL